MKFSILSAVHNESDFLPQMIASLEAQDHGDWEVVFVSDGSTDNSVEVIRAASERDSRIRLVGGGEKIGKVAAFNTAFRACSGDVIGLLAGDDTLPEDSLATRVKEFGDVDPARADVVAFFKLRTMSADPKQDGLVLPRGDGASHSGGTITMSRHLAERVFPIHADLVSEDLWLTRGCEGVADTVIECTEVVLNYRIHAGNSNPRNKPFLEMSAAMGARQRAWQLLLDEPRLALNLETRQQVSVLAELEQLRLSRRFIGMLTYRNAPFADRAAYMSMASPTLFRLRRRFFALLSGRRSR